MNSSPSFDLAVLGAGCSSFQLLHALSQHQQWQSQTALLVHDGAKLQRSWCFWANEPQPLQHLVSKSWSKLTFIGQDFQKTTTIAPYQYHYISGETFFDYFHTNFLPQHPNIQVEEAKVTQVEKKASVFDIHGESGQAWSATQVFSSLPSSGGAEQARFRLLQHFKGWFVETDRPVFDPQTATLMDFSIEQAGDARFVYILPFSATRALVEVTVFSDSLYEDMEYEQLLQQYFDSRFSHVTYQISEKETGAIPMTDQLFTRLGTSGELRIGTAAGLVKPSTGYAFRRMTQDSTALAKHFFEQQTLQNTHQKARFRFYDRLLLGILSEKRDVGSQVFCRLFQKTPMPLILKFLDERTTLLEDIQIFSQLPFQPFLRQIAKQR
jgi:lycopene beta-cyclase